MIDFFNGIWPYFKELKTYLGVFIGLSVALFAVLSVAIYVDHAVTAKILKKPVYSFKKIIALQIKFLLKKPVFPKNVDPVSFVLTPVAGFSFAVFVALVLFFGKTFLMNDYGALYVTITAMVSGYLFVFAGYFSGSRVGFLSALRSFFQTLCAQTLFLLIVLTIVIAAGSANFVHILNAQETVWFIIPFFPIFILFLLVSLMILNEKPFASSIQQEDSFGGALCEYSGILFLLFLWTRVLLFLILSFIGAFLFLGGGFPFFGVEVLVKTFFVFLTLVVMKTALPDVSSKDLTRLGFRIFFPFTLGWLVLTVSVVLIFFQGTKG